MDNITGKNAELMSSDTEKKVAVKADLINTANLLMAHQYELGALVDSNSSILIVADNISKLPDIKTSADYLVNAQNMVKEFELDIEYIDEKIEKELINGVDFYKMKIVINYMGFKVNQVYYSTISKEFSLYILITFINEAQQQELLNCVHSIKFLKHKK